MTRYRVFHGTREKGGVSGATSAGLGEWFGTDNEGYAKDHGHVDKYDIELKKPVKFDSARFRSFDRDPHDGFQRAVNFRKAAEQEGFDGIIVTHLDGVKEYILFNKTKAKKVV